MLPLWHCAVSTATSEVKKKIKKCMPGGKKHVWGQQEHWRLFATVFFPKHTSTFNPPLSYLADFLPCSDLLHCGCKLQKINTLSWFISPFSFCFVLFLSCAQGAPLQRQAGPDLTAAACLLSSAVVHSLIATPAPRLSPCCQPLPDLQRFSAADDPGSQPSSWCAFSPSTLQACS